LQEKLQSHTRQEPLTLKAEKLHEEPKNKSMMDLMKKEPNVGSMKEMSVSRQCRSSRSSDATRPPKRRGRSGPPNRMDRPRLIYGKTSKSVPELPKTLKKLKAEVETHIGTDNEVKAHS